MHRPFVVLLAPMICGIAAGQLVPGWEAVAAVLAAAASLAMAWCTAHRRAALSPAVVLTLMLAYLTIGPWALPRLAPCHVAYHLDGPEQIIEGIVASAPVKTNDRMRFVLAAHGIGPSGDKLRPACGKIQVTVMGRLKPLAIGDAITVQARPRSFHNFENPGNFDYRGFMHRQGILARAYVHARKLLRRQPATVAGFRRVLETYRARMARLIATHAHPDSCGILQALAIGLRSNLPSDMREVFNRLGVGHLLAISGLHIGLVAGAAILAFAWLFSFAPFFQRRGWVRKAAAGASLLPVFAYGLIAGFSPSTQRAVAMVAIVLLALLVNRKADPLNSLAVAAWCILLLDPPALMSVSFQLSFAAVTAIMIVWHIGTKRFSLLTIDYGRHALARRTKCWLGAIALTTVAATIGTMPLATFYFHRISLVGLAANIVLVPLVGYLVIPPALLAALILPASESLAAWLVRFASTVLTPVVHGMQALSHQPWVAMEHVPLSLVETIIAYGLLSGLALVLAAPTGKPVPWLRKAGWALTIVAALATATDAMWWYHDRWGRSQLRVTCIDVGSGLATLVEFPKGPVMLVDGGGFPDNSQFDIGARVLMPLLLSRKIRRIDTIVLSHPDSDHLNGLIYLLDRFPVGQVITNGQRIENMGCRQLDDLIARKQLHAPSYRTMQRRFLINGVQVEILHPPADFRSPGSRWPLDDTNGNSLVLRLQLGKASFLLPGDLTAAGEKMLVAKAGNRLLSTVLVVAHHGSRTSSSPDFVQAVSPRFAVISAGWYQQRYRPHEIVKQRIDVVGAQMLFTYRDGAISFTTDGNRIAVTTWKDPATNRSQPTTTLWPWQRSSAVFRLENTHAYRPREPF